MNGKLSPPSFLFVFCRSVTSDKRCSCKHIECHGAIGNKARHYISEINWPCTMFVIGKQDFLNVVFLSMFYDVYALQTDLYNLWLLQFWYWNTIASSYHWQVEPAYAHCIYGINIDPIWSGRILSKLLLSRYSTYYG